jgi:hypothetical protein
LTILTSMAGLVRGLTARSTPKPVIGYSDTETVKLDFDDTPFKVVKYWAQTAMRRFQLGGFLMLKSSSDHYHVVFNRSVTWAENLCIVAWVALLSHCESLQRWLVMQCIKMSSTLRVSSKRGKPSPRIVYRYGKQHGEIARFLRTRRQIKRMLNSINIVEKV